MEKSPQVNISQPLARILKPAFGPCEEFKAACKEMRWLPDVGHVPRGFFGATHDISEVELVLIVAEPGDPVAGESHHNIDAAYQYAGYALRTRRDTFHRNLRAIIDSCWPYLTFEQQMRKVWVTESVLCSAQRECGPISRSVSLACGQRYLLGQLSLFPNALIVALGRKAQARLTALGWSKFLSTGAAAPPGAYRRDVQESWRKIPEELELRRRATG